MVEPIFTDGASAAVDARETSSPLYRTLMMVPLRLSALPLMMTGILAACVGTAFHARPMITISRVIINFFFTIFLLSTYFFRFMPHIFLLCLIFQKYVTKVLYTGNMFAISPTTKKRKISPLR